LFPLGGSCLIAEDSKGPDVEDEKVRQALRSKQHSWLFFWQCSNAEHTKSTPLEVLAEEGRVEKAAVLKCGADLNGIATTVDAALEPAHKGIQTHAHELHPLPEDVTFQRPNETVTAPSSRVSWSLTLTTRLRTLPRPPTIALLLACPISVIAPLKALFVPLRNANGDPVIPFAPDGAPPLAFILDTATFLGSASVPLALICLGAALAKLKISKGIRGLPLGAISALTIGRLVLQPIIAIVMVEGLVGAGLINKADKVLRFAMM
jgi:predicted permease